MQARDPLEDPTTTLYDVHDKNGSTPGDYMTWVDTQFQIVRMRAETVRSLPPCRLQPTPASAFTPFAELD